MSFGTLADAAKSVAREAFRLSAEQAHSRSNLASGDTSWEIVTDEQRFLALEAESDRLWERTSDRRWSHSFTWFRTGWETTGRPRRRRMHILVLRRDGEAVLIWPLALRRRWFCLEAIALGSESTEYAPILVVDGPEAAVNLRSAWAFLRARREADVVEIPFVREGSTAHVVFSNDPTPRNIETHPAPYVEWDQFKTWDAYWGARSKKTRGEIGRLSRRFAELGEVTFELVEDHAEYLKLLDWSLRTKIDWMDRTGHENSFTRTPEYHAFLAALHERPTRQGRWVMFALKLDGRIVATKMGAADATRYEGFIDAVDPEFANYSTGSIILIKELEWARARGLRLDFRIGSEAYKLKWSTNVCPTVKYRFAVTGRGVVFLALERWIEQIRIAKDKVRTSIPKDVRGRIKAWMRSPFSAKGRRASDRMKAIVGGIDADSRTTP
jgi:CelD/BcsL family acetyltransferase involved in cellulose biosynthesis